MSLKKKEQEDYGRGKEDVGYDVDIKSFGWAMDLDCEGGLCKKQNSSYYEKAAHIRYVSHYMTGLSRTIRYQRRVKSTK